MVKVVWDSTTPPVKEETEMDRWEKWFPLVGLGGKWEAVKEAVEDDATRCVWARIMEMNRLSSLSGNVHVHPARKGG